MEPGDGRPEGFVDLPAEDTSFQEWLAVRYNYCPMELYKLALATGKYGDYDKLMEWYRRRYRYEKDLARMYDNNNPFTQEDLNNG